MKTLDDLHPSLKSALGIWMALRKLGFPADDIFVFRMTTTERLGVQLRADGQRIHWMAGPWDGTDLAPQYAEATKILKAAPETAVQRFWDVYRQWRVRRERLRLKSLVTTNLLDECSRPH